MPKAMDQRARVCVQGVWRGLREYKEEDRCGQEDRGGQMGTQVDTGGRRSHQPRIIVKKTTSTDIHRPGIMATGSLEGINTASVSHDTMLGAYPRYHAGK